jgi:hypothetical protein
VLAEYLHGQGVDVDPESWKGPTTSYGWMKNLLRATEELQMLLPPEVPFILVDDNQWGGRDFLPGYHILPFTESGGEYAGPPKDGAAGIEELERLYRQGAGTIVFTAAAFWWLDYYIELAEYLNSRCTRVATSDCVMVFDLSTLSAGAATKQHQKMLQL